MLNAHPEIASVGELKQLSRYARSSRKLGRQPRCNCGATSLTECPFWAQVDAMTKARIGRNLGELNTEDYSDVRGFDRDNAVLFDAISAVSKKKYVVDSSKHLGRFERLINNLALDVFPVFLLRDPKGQICSALRKHAKPQENAYGFIRLIGSYVWTNRRIHKLVKRRSHAVVHYEELAADPGATLTALMPELGLAFHPNQLEWATQVRHNIGGNRMRFGLSSQLKRDDQWRDELTLAQKLAIDLGTLPGRYL
jgi:hypothetical protein